MDSVVGFHQEEKDGKQFLVIQKPELNSIPKTQSSTSSVKATRHDHHFQPLFLCPEVRWRKDDADDLYSFPLTTSYEYILSTTRTQHDETSVDHPVLPLFWCNNKELDYSINDCDVCRGTPEFGLGYYFCEFHKEKYHKECVESPLRIKHPYHPEHPLQLSFKYSISSQECLCCGRDAYWLVYCCFICNVVMHTICAMQPISLFIEKQKRHEHSLLFFTRKDPLRCNVCGLFRKIDPTYICAGCNFVAHKDCMSSPTIIKISRHHHRISYTSSLQSKEWSCGVCRQSVNSDYGAYTCGKCSDYVVHSRCALDKDVWDGEELDGVPDEDDLIEDVKPFEIISKGVILHFLHDHDLGLEVNMLYDEKKLCQACVLPIYEGNFYSCKKCGFILHESCANAPRKIQHALHRHPLTLKDFSRISIDKEECYVCNACFRSCNGFVYMCTGKECYFRLDVWCASISEPFEFKDHEHALFLTLNQERMPRCNICKRESIKQLNCIKCDFIVCFNCASLPYKVRYKHDEHSLTLLWGKEACEKDWCEVCERNLTYTHEAIYSCKECCTFLHTECLLGRNPYLKPDHPYKYKI